MRPRPAAVAESFLKRRATASAAPDRREVGRGARAVAAAVGARPDDGAASDETPAADPDGRNGDLHDDLAPAAAPPASRLGCESRDRGGHRIDESLFIGSGPALATLDRPNAGGGSCDIRTLSGWSGRGARRFESRRHGLCPSGWRHELSSAGDVGQVDEDAGSGLGYESLELRGRPVDRRPDGRLVDRDPDPAEVAEPERVGDVLAADDLEELCGEPALGRGGGAVAWPAGRLRIRGDEGHCGDVGTAAAGAPAAVHGADVGTGAGRPPEREPAGPPPSRTGLVDVDRRPGSAASSRRPRRRRRPHAGGPSIGGAACRSAPGAPDSCAREISGVAGEGGIISPGGPASAARERVDLRRGGARDVEPEPAVAAAGRVVAADERQGAQPPHDLRRLAPVAAHDVGERGDRHRVATVPGERSEDDQGVGLAGGQAPGMAARVAQGERPRRRAPTSSSIDEG
jgi:hypothetical protein